MIERVEVEHDNLTYVCMISGTGWRCGHCTRGVIRPIVGQVCRVCSAVVRVVIDGPNTYTTIRGTNYRRDDH